MHERDLRDALIENGKYYEEGLLWHCAKNYYIFIERTWLITFFVILLSGFCVMGFNIYSLLPLKTNTTFIRYTENIDIEAAKPVRLYDIYKKNNDLQTVVEKYLLSKYLEAWEETKMKMDAENNFIRLNSSHRVYEQLLVEQSNWDQSKNANFRILDIQIRRSSKTGGKVAMAKVRFYNGDKTSEKTIGITFRTTDVLLAHRDIVPLELIVSSYEEIL